MPYEETLTIQGAAFQLSGVRLARDAAEGARVAPPPSGGCAAPEGGVALSSPPSSDSCLQHVVTLPSVFPGLPAALDVQLLVCIPKPYIPEASNPSSLNPMSLNPQPSTLNPEP